MKSLTEIQKDIRSLEKNISEMAASVKQIHSDLDNLKTSGRNEPVDYAAIQTLAKFMPFTGHPIDRMRDERACKLYLELLLNVARMNSEQMISADQLVFIQWILMQSKLDLSLEELLTDCYRMDTDSYDEMAEAIPIDSRGMLIIDTLIVAGCNTTFNGDACQYITDAAVLFGITKTEMILFANVAKAALCQNINHIKKEDFDDFITNVEPYGYYVKQDYIKDYIVSMRKIIVKISDEEAPDFKWKVKQRQEVKRRELVAVYTYKEKEKQAFAYKPRGIVQTEVRTTVSGTIFCFRDKCINYGVVSHHADNKDSVKSWALAKEQFI